MLQRLPIAFAPSNTYEHLLNEPDKSYILCTE